ncbi:BEL1-like homeodomain protein 3 [Raphanus sativus]|uniref:BEL1-like homeodomain protein 3 n=1 Tax=Raphanus sativus TaxID=3726 RepID=A0A9W3C611_RAPSA|nr:BEL1-like homeodomain protein 3 [Raphanus sativus]XP_056846897.1 BEL1-like homeodomain protein 3 [Raphanus sativus]KAJ4884575.1 BEL1-like homeodomain protein 3 [Raphanus sativus]
MAVYYQTSVGMQSLYQEPIYLNEQQQQQASSSSAEMVFIPPTSDEAVVTGLNGSSVSNDLSFQGGGLSLSLGNHQIQYHYQNLSNQLSYPSLSDENDKSLHHHQQQQPEHVPSSGYINGVGSGLYNNHRYETTGGFVSSVLRSPYLKPTQQLLDEVVSVRKLGGGDSNKKIKNNNNSDFTNNGSSENNNEELSSSERQELQSKKNKLLTMVNEVDARYNQYHHQMEALASSFEMVAGLGAAKPYTSVALNRISRHFRCLRDALKEQVGVMRGKLGEEEDKEEEGERIPRLRYLDQRLRQQRALHQQLGMVVRPSWRPQRGLPENSVSILRAWLFEHFLHPYPKESEKIMLAKQTGLSKNQVANWFINARVRLWKPMIEEMYKEEFGDSSELLSNSNQDNNNKQETSQLKHEDSSSSQQQSHGNNNNVTYTSDAERGDYDSLMNYHQGFGADDYNRYIGGLGNQQDGRFSNPHQLHDFVV